MILLLDRISSVPGATYGALHIDGRGLIAWTLEDPIRLGPKIAGETAIPAGTYDVRWREGGKWARRFRERYGVPGSLEICDVPNFSAVLFHNGNTPAHTRGCVLLGNRLGSASKPQVLDSRTATGAFVELVRDAVYARDLKVQITNPIR